MNGNVGIIDVWGYDWYGHARRNLSNTVFFLMDILPTEVCLSTMCYSAVTLNSSVI